MADIVIADDDKIYAATLKDFLQSQGHRVRCAYDGAQFSVLVNDRAPELILLDMQMPGGGGPASMTLLKNTPSLAGLPVIVASSMPVDKQAEWFGHMDRIRFLSKPFALDDLAKTVKELL